MEEYYDAHGVMPQNVIMIYLIRVLEAIWTSQQS